MVIALWSSHESSSLSRQRSKSTSSEFTRIWTLCNDDDDEDDEDDEDDNSMIFYEIETYKIELHLNKNTNFK
jgi:hypothetical protein